MLDSPLYEKAGLLIQSGRLYKQAGCTSVYLWCTFVLLTSGNMLRLGQGDLDGGGNAARGAAAQLRGDFLAAADVGVPVTVRGV